MGNATSGPKPLPWVIEYMAGDIDETMKQSMFQMMLAEARAVAFQLLEPHDHIECRPSAPYKPEVSSTNLLNAYQSRPCYIGKMSATFSSGLSIVVISE